VFVFLFEKHYENGMQKTIYFIRHAQSHPCKNTHFSFWPLSETGARQAQELAKHLPRLGIQKMYSSPFVRCLETVKPFCESAGLDVEVHDDLRERLVAHGIADRETWIRSWQDHHFALPDCESSHQAQKRFVDAVKRIADATEHEVISISSHGNVIALFLHHLDPENYTREHAEKILNPHVTKIRYHAGRFEWEHDFVVPEIAALSTHHSQTPGLEEHER